MVCKVCGMENADDFAFCAGCGAALEPEYAEAPAYQYEAPVETEVPAKGLGLAAMIVGIVASASTLLSVVTCGITGGIAFPASIAGLIMSIIAQNKAKAVGAVNSKAKIGFITSLIPLILGVVGIILLVVYYVLVIALGIMSSGY